MNPNTKAKLAEFRQGWPVLLAATLGCATGVTIIPFYSLGIFIAPLQSEFGWGRGDIASSFLYTAIMLAIISPVLNMIDRLGVKTISLVSIPLVAVVLFILSHFDGSLRSFHALYALAALVGGGTTPITYTRAVNAVFDKARGLALGLALAGIGITSILLPTFLSHVIDGYGWRAGYLMLAVISKRLASMPLESRVINATPRDRLGLPLVLLGMAYSFFPRRQRQRYAARGRLRRRCSSIISSYLCIGCFGIHCLPNCCAELSGANSEQKVCSPALNCH